MPNAAALLPMTRLSHSTACAVHCGCYSVHHPVQPALPIKMDGTFSGLSGRCASGLQQQSAGTIAPAEASSPRSALAAQAGGEDVTDAMARIYVWLRYSAARQLTWQRNYNTQPRILGDAQHRLTRQIAQVGQGMA